MTIERRFALIGHKHPQPHRPPDTAGIALMLAGDGGGDDGPPGPPGPAGSGAAGANGLGYSGLTSTTSITIGTGSKSFTVNQSQGTNAFAVGDRVRVYGATATNYVEGLVTTYSGTTFTVNADATGGSGTLASWSVTIIGQPGATGATGGTGNTGATGPTGPAGASNIPVDTFTSGTLTAADAAKCCPITAATTIPSSVFAAGDAVSLYNNSASAITLTQGASLTLRFAGSTATGNRTLAPRGMATVWFLSTTEAIIMGPGLT